MFASFNNYTSRREQKALDNMLNALCEGIAFLEVPFNEFWGHVGLPVFLDQTYNDADGLVKEWASHLAFQTGLTETPCRIATGRLMSESRFHEQYPELSNFFRLIESEDEEESSGRRKRNRNPEPGQVDMDGFDATDAYFDGKYGKKGKKGEDKPKSKGDNPSPFDSDTDEPEFGARRSKRGPAGDLGFEKGASPEPLPDDDSEQELETGPRREKRGPAGDLGFDPKGLYSDKYKGASKKTGANPSPFDSDTDEPEFGARRSKRGPAGPLGFEKGASPESLPDDDSEQELETGPRREKRGPAGDLGFDPKGLYSDKYKGASKKPDTSTKPSPVTGKFTPPAEETPAGEDSYNPFDDWDGKAFPGRKKDRRGALAARNPLSKLGQQGKPAAPKADRPQSLKTGSGNHSGVDLGFGDTSPESPAAPAKSGGGFLSRLFGGGRKKPAYSGKPQAQENPFNNDDALPDEPAHNPFDNWDGGAFPGRRDRGRGALDYNPLAGEDGPEQSLNVGDDAKGPAGDLGFDPNAYTPKGAGKPTPKAPLARPKYKAPAGPRAAENPFSDDGALPDEPAYNPFSDDPEGANIGTMGKPRRAKRGPAGDLGFDPAGWASNKYKRPYPGPGAKQRPGPFDNDPEGETIGSEIPNGPAGDLGFNPDDYKAKPGASAPTPAPKRTPYKRPTPKPVGSGAAPGTAGNPYSLDDDDQPQGPGAFKQYLQGALNRAKGWQDSAVGAAGDLANAAKSRVGKIGRAIGRGGRAVGGAIGRAKDWLSSWAGAAGAGAGGSPMGGAGGPMPRRRNTGAGAFRTGGRPYGAGGGSPHAGSSQAGPGGAGGGSPHAGSSAAGPSMGGTSMYGGSGMGGGGSTTMYGGSGMGPSYSYTGGSPMGQQGQQPDPQREEILKIIKTALNQAIQQVVQKMKTDRNAHGFQVAQQVAQRLDSLIDGLQFNVNANFDQDKEFGPAPQPAPQPTPQPTAGGPVPSANTVGGAMPPRQPAAPQGQQAA